MCHIRLAVQKGLLKPDEGMSAHFNCISELLKEGTRTRIQTDGKAERWRVAVYYD